jgi:hypothetical protein
MRAKFTKEMESAVDSFENKAVNLAAYIQNLSVEETAIKNAVQEMQCRSDKITKKIVFLKEYLKSQMQSCDVSEITKSPYYVIKIRKNPVSVEVSDTAILPDEYVSVKVTKAPNKVLIREHLQQGVLIDGCALQQTSRLDIK